MSQKATTKAIHEIYNKITNTQTELDYFSGLNIVEDIVFTKGKYQYFDSDTLKEGNYYYAAITDFIKADRFETLDITRVPIIANVDNACVVAYNENKEPLKQYSVIRTSSSPAEISLKYNNNSAVKFIRINVSTSGGSGGTINSTIHNTIPFITENDVLKLIGIDNDAFQNTSWDNSKKYKLTLLEDIVLTKNVTLPKYCIIDTNLHSITVPTDYTLSSSDENIPVEIITNQGYRAIYGINWVGKFIFSNGLFFSNIMSVTDYANTKIIALNKWLSLTHNSVIYADIDMATASVPIGTNTINPSIKLIGLGSSRRNVYLNGSLTLSNNVSIKNISLNFIYNEGFQIGDNCTLDNCDVNGTNTRVNGVYSVIKNCDFTSYTLNVKDKTSVIGCRFIGAKNRNNIVVEGSYNKIIGNTTNGGIVGIILLPTLNTSKTIEYNIIKNNQVYDTSEESISLDYRNSINSQNIFKLLGFVDKTNDRVIRCQMLTSVSDMESYIGYYIGGVSENVIGKYSKITNIELENNNIYQLTLNSDIFEYDVVDNTRVYPYNEQIYLDKGYTDYSNSLFYIGFAFVGNIISGNFVNNSTIDIYGGGAFANVISENYLITPEQMNTGIYIINNAVQKGGFTYSCPMCHNIVSNNIVPLSSIMSLNKNKDNIDVEGMSKELIRYNAYIGNVSRTLRIDDKYSVVDSSGITGRLTNPPYSYNNNPVAQNNLTPVLYTNNINVVYEYGKKGKIIIINDNGTLKIFKGEYSDNYGKEPIIELL